MNICKKICCLCFLLLFCTVVLCGCAALEVTCPFTEITWKNTLDEVLTVEGEPLDSYPSTYQGTTYVFPKLYKNLEGSIKYMFDAEDKLVSMAWTYIPTSTEDMEKVYTALVEDTEASYGPSGFDSKQSTAWGQVWYLENGNIMLAVMSTGVNEAIQFQFFHPDVSSEKPQ